MKKNKRLKIKSVIYTHIVNNSKEYTLVTLIFIIGIFLGVMFVNNMQDAQQKEVITYLDEIVENLKNTQELETAILLKTTIVKNIILAIILWFFGTTVIGIPIVFGIIIYKGFCLGYTISTIVTTIGVTKGIIFSLIALLLQNILFVPAIIAIAVSGFKLYKSIIKNIERENIKIEIIRHTLFSIFMLLVLCMAAVIEIMISTNLLKNFIKYF